MRIKIKFKNTVTNGKFYCSILVMSESDKALKKGGSL